MTEKFSLDFSTTRDEAVELTIHHLRLAAMFFQNTPDGTRSVQRAVMLEELDRQVKDSSGRLIKSLEYSAMVQFLNTIIDSYEDDKEQS